MQAQFPEHAPEYGSRSEVRDSLEQSVSNKRWRNRVAMVLCFVLTYALTVYWLLPSVGSDSVGWKAPLVCALFWLGCTFGERAGRYRSPV